MRDGRGAPLDVERRFPRKAFLLVLIGLAGAGAVAAYGLGHGVPAHVYAFGFVLLLMALFQLPIVCAYVFGADKLVLRDDGFTYGRDEYAYADVGAIACSVTGEETKVWLSNGKRLVWRWDIWPDEQAWNEVLARRTFDHLYAAAKATFQQGGRVGFGKDIFLDRQAFHVGKASMPLEEVDELRFSDATDNGSRRRTLRMSGARRQLAVDQGRLHNQHVLLALLREALPAGERVRS